MNILRYTQSFNRNELAPRRFFSALGGLDPFEALFTPAFQLSLDDTSIDGDLYSNEEAYYLRYEVPGVAKENVKVAVERNQLTVIAEALGKSGKVERSTRHSLVLPDDVDVEAISAHTQDGMLTIRLPKSEAHKPRIIPVR